jgi:hypothetical protein
MFLKVSKHWISVVIDQLAFLTMTNIRNLVPRAFCYRGWMVSKKGPGFGWSVLQPDWSMILNVSIQYMWE